MYTQRSVRSPIGLKTQTKRLKNTIKRGKNGPKWPKTKARKRIERGKMARNGLKLRRTHNAVYEPYTQRSVRSVHTTQCTKRTHNAVYEVPSDWGQGVLAWRVLPRNICICSHVYTQRRVRSPVKLGRMSKGIIFRVRLA
jgi:hypothetical protein